MLKEPQIYIKKGGNKIETGFFGTDRYGILVDAGIGIRTIKKTLKELGIGLDIIRAVFITHDHADHIKAVGHLGEKFGIPVYSTPEVHAGINKSYCMTEKLSTCVHYLHKGETMELEDFAITAFEVPHDGTDNVGYCMNIDGKIFSAKKSAVSRLLICPLGPAIRSFKYWG